jgi:hypothetical protein
MIHIDHNDGRIYYQNHKHQNPIDSHDSSRSIINYLKPRIVVINQGRIKNYAKNKKNIHKVDDVGNRINHTIHIKNINSIIVQIISLSRQKKISYGGYHIFIDGCYQSQVHCDIKN